MTDIQRKETEAFISFFATYELTRPVTTVSDLSDGAALFEVLSLMCVSQIIPPYPLNIITYKTETKNISANLPVPLPNSLTTGFCASAH